MENMLHEEKKHFATNTGGNNPPTAPSVVAVAKVSPIWTKDDIESLRKGIVSKVSLSSFNVVVHRLFLLKEQHSQNWSKVARAVGTKTTLQVKSYIKSHPELVSSSSVHISNTPSPPQFINEVEVSNEETVCHFFSVSDIVHEAEVPAVSIEEVIATGCESPPVKNGKKIIRLKPKPPSKDVRYCSHLSCYLDYVTFHFYLGN